MHLFVYGSLRRKGWAHDRLVGATFIENVLTSPQYTLLNMGDYPGMIEGGTLGVVGELYSIDEDNLPALDRFEGHPNFFRRTEVTLSDGRVVTSYLLNTEHAVDKPVIPSGDWQHRTRP